MIPSWRSENFCVKLMEDVQCRNLVRLTHREHTSAEPSSRRKSVVESAGVRVQPRFWKTSVWLLAPVPLRGPYAAALSYAQSSKPIESIELVWNTHPCILVREINILWIPPLCPTLLLFRPFMKLSQPAQVAVLQRWCAGRLIHIRRQNAKPI